MFHAPNMLLIIAYGILITNTISLVLSNQLIWSFLSRDWSVLEIYYQGNILRIPLPTSGDLNTKQNLNRIRVNQFPHFHYKGVTWM